MNTSPVPLPQHFDLSLFERLDPDSDDLKDFSRVTRELIHAFRRSAESKGLRTAAAAYWIDRALFYGWEDLGATPATLTADLLAEILCDIFPEETSLAHVEQAAAVIPILRAFWSWMGREYQLPNAAEILDLLEVLEEDYPAILNNDPGVELAVE